MRDLIARLPKAELHLHIEGSFEPELMFGIARRNRVEIPFNSVEEIRAAYSFSNLQEFLDIYYQGMAVLRNEEDYFDLTRAYLDRVAADNATHAEIFFDPQAHTARGVPFETVVNGVCAGLDYGRSIGVSSFLIMSFLRHLPEDDGFETLRQAEPFMDRFIGVGLDSSEQGNPPEKFARLFARCRKMGMKLCCHAGEEGPPEYVRQALFDLEVDRIDHGNRAMEDPALVREIAARGIALTVCPTSNLALKVIGDMRASPVKRMLDTGVLATIHSDDPAYFGGYLNTNYEAVADALALTDAEIATLARNSFKASFLPDDEKAHRIAAVDAALRGEA